MTSPDKQAASGIAGIPSATHTVTSGATYGFWLQNGMTERGITLIEVSDRVSIELTGSLTNKVGDDEVQQVAEVILAAPALVNLLARLEPHLDAIVCYASTMGEHEPNAIAADVRGWLGHLRDVGALA